MKHNCICTSQRWRERWSKEDISHKEVTEKEETKKIHAKCQKEKKKTGRPLSDWSNWYFSGFTKLKMPFQSPWLSPMCILHVHVPQRARVRCLWAECWQSFVPVRARCCWLAVHERACARARAPPTLHSSSFIRTSWTHEHAQSWS